MSLAPLIIVSGPSGCGKSTVLRRLLQEQTWPLRLSVSVTTRTKREKEQDGVDYFFWTVPEFLKHRDNGEFLEWAEVHGNYYGTPRSEVQPYREQGIGVFLDIDVQGWEQVRKICPDVVSIFFRTSRIETLRERLLKRATETPEAIQRRLNNAPAELARANEYDYQVINDDLEAALKDTRAILSVLFERNKHAR